MIMLTTVATVMGSHSLAIRSKYNINATPGGTKKNAMFEIRNLQIGVIDLGFITFVCSRIVRRIIPQILPGIVTHGMSARRCPAARHAKIMPNCFTIFSQIIVQN